MYGDGWGKGDTIDLILRDFIWLCKKLLLLLLLFFLNLVFMVSFATMCCTHIWFFLICLQQEWLETNGDVSLLDTLYKALDEVSFL